MTDAWEPATPLEQQLRDALRDGDQDTYFALVNGTELFVPLPPGESEINPSGFTWPTNTREGRTHVLAYTSGEAARACLGPAYQNFLRMTLADMARSWPDPEWWLAVDSGLPIEGYLPAWFIAQLTGTQPGQEPAHAQDAPPAQDLMPAREAPPVVTVPPSTFHDGVPPSSAQNGTHPSAVPDIPDDDRASVTIHDGMQAVPAHDGLPPAVEPLPSVPDAAGPDAAPPALPPAPPAPLPAPAPSLEEAATGPAPRPETVPPHEGVPAGDAPVALHIAPDAEFSPLDEEERTLWDAAVRGDRDTFLRTLLSVRQIWVPMVDGGDLMLGPGRPGFEWYVEETGGRRTVPLFTGPGRMRDAMGGRPFVLSDLAKVLRFWPDPSLELVVNGGTPIGASIPGDAITAISQRVDAEAAALLAREFPAQSDAERQMFDARADRDMLVKVLLDTAVFLPVWSRTPPAVQTPPSDPSFPWSAVPVRGHASVLAFTSFDWMKAAVGTTGFVMPTFTELLMAWPDQDWSVSVNPGTPIEVSLSGAQIRALISAIPEHPREPAPPAVDPQRPEAALHGAIPPQPDVLPESAALAQDFGTATSPHDSLDDADLPDSLAGPWTVMQKVVPHAQVSWYLEQAYDRVAGFVHRVQDVIDLGTPGRLYESLGLLCDGSPFSADDTEVHIIRWPAYRAALYRTPFGGQAEDSLRVWGDSGWVVESPPFSGDGFAPGSGGSIREYKVDSLRVPHGSEMYAIGSDGSEHFVARYDADRMVWENSE
jgi:hypothetical protein